MGQHINNLAEISMDGFQVVSGEMFSHFPKISEASCTLWSTSISFSKSSIIALHSCEHILIRVNAKEKCILLSPAPSSDKDSISWLKDAKNLQAKKIDCKLFTSQLYKTWGFDETYCYRSYGRIVSVDNKVMLLFDFKKPESWKYQSKGKNKENRDG